MSAVVDFVGDVISDVGDAVSDVVDVVGDAIGDVVEFVGDNPLILAAAVPFIGPEVALAAGAEAAGATAAEMLAAEAASDLAMGFSLGDVALGLEGIGGVEALGAAGAGLGGLSFGGVTATDMLAEEALKDLAMGFSPADIAMGLESIGGLDAIGMSPSTLGQIYSSVGSDLNGLSSLAEEANVGGYSPSFSIDFSTALPNASEVVPQLKTWNYAPVVDASPIQTGFSATPSLPGAFADTLSAAIENPSGAFKDIINTIDEASNTPIAKAMKTVNSGLNIAQTVNNIYSQQEIAEKQKALLDAQLNAYRTTGMQTGQLNNSGKFAPNEAFGYKNYSGQFGIGV